MTDLITLTGPLVDHAGATPLAGVTVTATPSRVITRTSDGKDALTDASTVTAGPPVLDDEGDPLPDQPDEGTFELELVHAAGLRYLITYRVQGKVLRPYTLDCDSWPAGSTVTIADLPPIAGVPPSAVEDLQAWVLEKLAEGMSQETIEAAVIAYLDENPVGIPAHNDTTGRDAADAHPMASITGLVAALAGKQAAGSYATAAQGAKADTAVQPADLGPYATDADLSGHASDTTAVHGIADTSALVLTTDPRLSDARTPTAHKSTHATGGTDALTPADIGAAPAAAGVPSGGTTGQVLGKASAADRDTTWVDQIGGGGGIETVSGVVTLTGAGAPVREFYTTASATINGVTFPAGTAVVFRRSPDATWGYKVVEGWTPIEPEDTTAPNPGTLAVSAITATSFTLTVSGASDETALHSQPYAFSIDGGAFSTWQSSATYNATGRIPETEYTCAHKVRDAAANEATGASITVATDVEEIDPSWAPGDLGVALFAWYDASDAATITASSGVVSQWRDKSGNARHLAPHSSGPVTGSATQNGRNVVAFTQDPIWTGAGSGASGAQPFTVAFVGKYGDEGFTPAVSLGASPPSYSVYHGEGKWRIYSGEVLQGATAFNTSPHLFTSINNGASSSARVDRSVVATGDAGANGIQNVILGSASNTGGITGWIGEVVIVTAALSGADLSKLEAYLGAKWATP